MSTRSFSLPLSRWHHIADRIRVFGEAKRTSALAVLEGTPIRNALTAEQVEALKQRGQKALADLNTARTAVQTVAVIRERLATANAEYGVNAVLSQAEGKRKEAALLRAVANVDLLTKVPLENVNTVLSQQKTEREYGFNGIRPAVVDANALAAFEDEAIVLESEAAALTDAVADLNRNVLAIDLPIELAQAAGLK